ncbi:helix-turn-helix transcriptional regulator [Hamadaea sp. NPDC051192]|uniref:helix-turn-helix domain-containing protein n=1 Tax=Hamadaea sp. NPDC051192 TaxID=3154940 RepID=UPI00342FF22C
MSTFADGLRRLRVQRGLSQRDLAERVIYDPSYIAKLEAGRTPSERAARELDVALSARGDLIAAAHLDQAARRDTNPSATTDLLARLRRADAGAATLDQLAIEVEQLCCRYVHDDPSQLRTETHGLLRRVSGVLRRGSPSLRAHTELLVQAGWLALLAGCLEYDMGLSASAENTRVGAIQLGREAGASEIVGWGYEMAAWFALTSGRYEDVLDHARAGQNAAPEHGVRLQLLGQEAKALARLGDVDGLRRVLDLGQSLLDQYGNKGRTDNHFVIDTQKWPFYSMDAMRLAGATETAAEYAQIVIDTHTTADGQVTSPMRVAEARLTLAVAAARAGELEQAVDGGIAALAAARQSLPSLLMVAGELDAELQAQYRGAPEAQTYRSAVRDLQAALGNG